MRNLKFGVEIEYFGVTVAKTIEALRAEGIAVADFEGYTHTVMNTWKVTTDVSVTSRGTAEGKGLELVSPILYEDEGLEELEKVYKILDSIGAKVDKTCGTHVHFDIADFTVQDAKNLVVLYYNKQNIINSILPKSRRGRNSFCHTIDQSSARYVKDCATSISGIAMGIGSRYHVINFQSYVKYGTVEFRQFGGTLEFEKTESWIVMLYQMLDHAKYTEEPIELRDTPYSVSGKRMNEFLNQLNLDDTEIGEYIINRYNHFREVS